MVQVTWLWFNYPCFGITNLAIVAGITVPAAVLAVAVPVLLIKPSLDGIFN